MTIAAVIDYETTGTPDEEGAEIIEMARVTVDTEARQIVGRWDSLCRPRGTVPPVARAVHHITDHELAGAPEARELWDELFDPPPVYMVAHNAKFEQHFTPSQWPVTWICTYKVARIVWPDAPGHSNQVLRYWLDLPVDPELALPAHRALPDAYVTAHLFIRLLDHKTPEEMATISRYPALLKIMNFGKHKGMAFADAPTDYLEWIRDKSDMNEDTKFSARYWLKKRA